MIRAESGLGVKFLKFLFVLWLAGMSGLMGAVELTSSSDQLSTKFVTPIPEISGAAPFQLITIFEGDHWKVTRSFPSGHIDLVRKDRDPHSEVRLDLPFDWRMRIYPKLIHETSAGKLYIVSYDLLDTVPSGRSQLTVKDGLDIWEIDKQTSKLPRKIATSLLLGGIDMQMYGNFRDDGFSVLCGDNTCYSDGGDAVWRQWKMDELREHEFVEVAFGGKRVSAIVRKKFDDRKDGQLTSQYADYYLVNLRESGVEIQQIKTPGIPWRLSFVGGRPVYNIARSREEFGAIFLYDSSRLGQNGVHEFGNNNLEGRIAWGSTYYLNGFISALTNPAQELFIQEPPGLRARVSKELSLISELCVGSTYPQFLTKRYSLEREPIESVVHLGRILVLFARAKVEIAYQGGAQCIERLTRKLKTLEGLLEENIVMVVGNQKTPYLGIRKNMPFWADGINVPYNFISAYASGLFSTGISRESATKLRKMLDVIEKQEKFIQFPKTWRYCSGLCDKGWNLNDHVSVNTPSWSGNGGAIAHVSYRTMDARALLTMLRSSGRTHERKLIEHFSQLTETGWLLPSLGDELIKAHASVQLQNHVARRHARAVAAWELESSIWALASLASQSRPSRSK